MMFFSRAVLAVLLIFSLPIILSAEEYAPNQVIVRYKDGYAATKSLARNSRSILSNEAMPAYLAENTFLLPTNQATDNAIETLSQDSDVLYVQPNYKVKALVTPNDRYLNSDEKFAYPFKADNGINAFKAWDKIHDADNITVAVIDSGIRKTHDDLRENMSSDEAFDVSNSNAGEDLNGHGTHVAGIIGAVGDNTIGTAGVAWRVKLLPIRVLNKDGEGYTSDVVAGIDYAISKKVDIINASYGSDSSGFNRAEYEAVKRAVDAGILFVAASGNSNKDTDSNPEFPAAYGLAGTVSVGASDSSSHKARFSIGLSNYGQTTVHLFAPGREILSTLNADNESYGVQSGTSMATPFITGAAALIKAKSPYLKPKQIEQILINSVRQAPALVKCASTGGILDLAKAVNFNLNRLYDPPYDLQTSLVQGSGRTVKLTWKKTLGQTEIWRKLSENSVYELLDRVSSDFTSYTDTVSGNDITKAYYRIRGLRFNTYTPFVRVDVTHQEHINIYPPIIASDKAEPTRYNLPPDDTELKEDIAFTASPMYIKFDPTRVGEVSRPIDITITNNGVMPLVYTINTVSANYRVDYELSSCLPDAPLYPEQSCFLSLRFAPQGDKRYAESELMSYILITGNDNEILSIPVSADIRLNTASVAQSTGGCSVSDKNDYLFIIMLLAVAARFIRRRETADF